MKLAELYQKVRQGDPKQFGPVRARFAVIVLFAAVALVALPLISLADILPLVLSVLLLSFACNLLSLAWIVWGKGVKYRVYFATFVDFFLITIALHYIGGIESTLSWAYAVVLITTASIHGMRVGAYAAVISSLMYSCLLIAEFKGVIPHIGQDTINPAFIHEDPSFLYIVLISNNVLFFIAAAVSGFLSEKLVRSRNEVEERNKKILAMQDTLQEYMGSLERTVAERTGELTMTNEQLRREIAEHEKAKQALRESKEKYRDLVEKLNEVIYAIDTNGVLTYMSPAMESFTGYRPEEVIGRSFSEFISPEEVPFALEGFQRTLVGTAETHEYRVLTKSGEKRWIRASSRAIIENDNVVGVQGVLSDITDRKRAEIALRESEKRYRNLHNIAPLAFVIWDRQCRVTGWNKRAEEMFGWSKEEVLGQNFFEFLIPERARPQVEAVVDALLKGDLPNHSINENLTKSGEIILCEWNNSIEYDSEGRVAGALSVGLDITERKRAEEKLRASEEKYRTLLGSIEIGHFETDLAGSFIFFNDTICRNLGYSRDELMGMNYRQYVNEENAKIVYEAFNTVYKTGRVDKAFISDVISKDGTEKPMEYSVSLVRDHDGQPIGFRGVVRDITERKRAEELLRRSEEKYRSLFEESRDIILITTPEGKFLDINPAGVEFYGYSSKEELLNTLTVQDTYVNPEDRDEFQRIMAERGFVKDHELKLKRKDGQQRIALLTANTVCDKKENVTAYRGVFRDITEQKQLEQQFLQAQKMESIGTLAGGIAHDFNNILGGILGYASLIKTRINEGHSLFNYVDTIEKGAMRAAELTAKLLAFARGGKYDTRPVDLNSIIGETLGIIGRTFDKSIDIRTHLDPQLPAIEADAGQMQQVLMNLCVNASDAMPDGGKLIIETSVETFVEEYANRHTGAKSGSHVCVSVTDTGIGMDKGTLQRIFEPFFTTKEEGKGTGLGLSMIYGVVKNHGGFVNVYSEPRAGTTIKVYLPASGKSPVKQSVKLETPSGGDELILVVDDEESMRAFAKEALEARGYRVLLAADGEEAVEVFKERDGDISLVILDMIMPKMGGRETYSRLKEMNSETKALLSTGYSQNGKAQEILSSGVKGFIQKPYQVNELLSKVRSVLDA
ncbi:MAG: PAS domain S-box protein [Candidatus Abyssubacteria bacterium]|nr:PAS domain S-box protein [Candidatus Abyssubacteria bacterium]